MFRFLVLSGLMFLLLFPGSLNLKLSAALCGIIKGNAYFLVQSIRREDEAPLGYSNSSSNQRQNLKGADITTKCSCPSILRDSLTVLTFGNLESLLLRFCHLLKFYWILSHHNNALLGFGRLSSKSFYQTTYKRRSKSLIFRI